MTDSPLVRWADYDAVLFDLDGVLTPTAEVHMRAWAALFDAYFAEHDIAPAYTSADYYAYVDGKPRYDGVRSLLAARGIVLPEGDPADPPTAETVCGLGNRKNAEFERELSLHGVTAYPGSVALLDHLATLPIGLAVVSSSANAPDVLAAAGIADRFPVVVDGSVARAQGLPGKPAPDTFAYAAHSLGADDKRAIVVEDAVSGVEAGAAGDFGLVIGVNRGAGHQVLTDHGADVVVDDLGELVGGFDSQARSTSEGDPLAGGAA
ncbi:beta-phosphoglucomutase family hydrolase [Mumia zhuanghuii]|uniref:HAD family hydrolase n=2 Tax=Mumia TaxID=1546255 RepID=A0ABW1QL12_9ACTN|nr:MULTISPECIES: beta-phosphoglucomutase family hydrolase [Mumia]KAA1424973.1 beta-phosphoglucomutase family hydrolase [Mumia zhuanghuii]